MKPLWMECNHCSYRKFTPETLTLDAILMNRHNTHKKEFSREILENLLVLQNRVNQLLKKVGISLVNVSSGWRPPSLNSAVVGAAKKSNHMIGKAVDIIDTSKQGLAKAILEDLSKPSIELLTKFDLSMESPKSTNKLIGQWVHLQSVLPKSGNRVFIP